MISVNINGSRFNYRVAAIVIVDGKLLLEKDKLFGFWFMPGGRCEINEESTQTLLREFSEEVKYKISPIRLVYLCENFYEYDNEKYHEIGMYYLCKLSDKNIEPIYENEFNGLEDGHIFKWHKLSEIENLNFYPIELKHKLANQEFSNIQHLIIKDPH